MTRVLIAPVQQYDTITTAAVQGQNKCDGHIRRFQPLAEGQAGGWRANFRVAHLPFRHAHYPPLLNGKVSTQCSCVSTRLERAPAGGRDRIAGD